MVDLLKNVFQTLLFDGETGHERVVFAEPRDETGQQGIWLLPKEIFPMTSEVHGLPDGEEFLDALKQVLSTGVCKRLLLLPPFMAPRGLSPNLRAEYPQMGLEEIALQIALEHMSRGSRLAVILSAGGLLSSFSKHNTRKKLFTYAYPRFVLTHDHSWQALGIPMHPAFRMSTLVLEKSDNVFPLKFFKIPQADIENQQLDITADLLRLTKQEGGKTKYGYVLRNPPEPGEILLHDKYHPDLLHRRRDMQNLGKVKPLHDLVEVRRGLDTIRDAHLLLDAKHSNGIPVLEGRDIQQDGNLTIEDPRYRAEVSSGLQLKAGDLCLRTIIGRIDRLSVAEISRDLPPLVPSHSVLVLRPKAGVSPEDIELLLAFLRSKTALEFLRAEGVDIHLHPTKFLSLPVPIPDEDLRTALKSLEEASIRFESWKEEAEQARSSLFEFPSAKDAHLHLLSAGRRSRQRQRAAELVDNFRHRVRTRFPHPVAYRWRTAESAHPDLEGYVQVLECAEVTVCYLAIMAILLANKVEGAEIIWLRELAKRMSGPGSRGTNMGDWISILREVRDAKRFRNVPENVPFYEVLTFLEDKEVDTLLQRLYLERNDQAHGRGPKGSNIPTRFQGCLQDLETFLKAVEFISEYPLRYIERTRWDSLRTTNYYEYRDLVGDHPLVPLASGVNTDANLEAHSLYLVDRQGGLHLLRPFLTREECPVCGSRSTFFLDSYNNKSDVCYLKSLEDGHSHENYDVAEVFRDVGFLLPQTST
jgi:hypothetical protein